MILKRLEPSWRRLAAPWATVGSHGRPFGRVQGPWGSTHGYGGFQPSVRAATWVASRNNCLSPVTPWQGQGMNDEITRPKGTQDLTRPGAKRPGELCCVEIQRACRGDITGISGSPYGIIRVIVGSKRISQSSSGWPGRGRVGVGRVL